MITRLPIDARTDDAPLATSVWADRGDPLFKAGVVLRQADSMRLMERGFRSIFVSLGPSRSEPELIRPAVRRTVWAALMETYEFLDHVSMRGAGVHPSEVIEHTAALANACDALIADQRDREALATPPPTPVDPGIRRSHDAMNGAAVAVFLGLHFKLPSGSLRDLAHGMLLRDVAQEAEAIRGGALLPGDRVAVEGHANEAYALLDDLGWGSASMRQVVQQHHERQDGSGYPNKLKGLGSVRRMLGPRFNRELMHPLAELAGVADVFTALNSDRPHRLAFSPRQVTAELMQHGERSLSQEAAAALLDAWDAPSERAASHDAALHLGRSVSATGLGNAAGR